MMSALSATSPFVLAALLFGMLGGVLILSGLTALLRWRPLRFLRRTLMGLLLLSLGVIAGGIGVGMQGYRALTREDLAARVQVRPLGPQRFEATLTIPDRLHTSYELDRVAGRYDDIAQERSAERTIFQLEESRMVDLFGLRRRYAALAPLLDAEYGSGTFVPVKRRADFEVRISTTGLLIREVPPASSARD